MSVISWLCLSIRKGKTTSRDTCIGNFMNEDDKDNKKNANIDDINKNYNYNNNNRCFY